LRTLRLRRGFSLAEIASLAGLDISYLSRLERDALQNAKPKPETINRVLDALAATLAERDAVYHVEYPPLGTPEIEVEAAAVAREAEDDAEPVELIDEQWYVWYNNRSARAALGLSPEEYGRTIGGHLLHAVIDPANPRYSRVPDEEREAAFAQWTRMFKTHFAGQEFDAWYQRVVARVYDFPWAAAIWEHPPAMPPALFLERQDLTINNPAVGKLRFRFQLNRLMTNPRFHLAGWTPLNESTARQLASLRSRPEFAYSHQEAPAGIGGDGAGRWVNISA
jgi:transcriptional regulator with XRE-family HTH domain